jgi:hypothetical protein
LYVIYDLALRAVFRFRAACVLRRGGKYAGLSRRIHGAGATVAHVEQSPMIV